MNRRTFLGGSAVALAAGAVGAAAASEKPIKLMSGGTMPKSVTLHAGDYRKSYHVPGDCLNLKTGEHFVYDGHVWRVIGIFR